MMAPLGDRDRVQHLSHSSMMVVMLMMRERATWWRSMIVHTMLPVAPSPPPQFAPKPAASVFMYHLQRA